MLIKIGQRAKQFVFANQLVLSLALLSGFLTIIANRSGVGWSWDTSDYVAVGKNFANGNGLLDATGITMTVRPPGLSIVIGFGDLLGLSVNLTVQILNSVCAAVLVLGAHQLLQIAEVKKSIAVIATSFIAFSPALLWQYSMIWSEPPFIALLIVLVPVWFWLQRNERIDGTLTGARAPGGGSLIDPLKTFNATVGSWLTASPVEGGIYMSWIDYSTATRTLGSLFLICLVVLLTVFLYLQIRNRKLAKLSNVLLLSISMTAVYVAFSAYRFVHFELGPLDNRMMIPVFVPLVLIVAITIDQIQINTKWLRQSVAALFVIFVGFQALSSTNDALSFGQSGRHWAAKTIKDQPIHKFVMSLPSESSLMSNQPQQLYSVWQKSSVYNQYQLDLAQATKCERRYFVWYNSTYDDGTPNVEGQPENAASVFSDQSGTIFDLGPCASEINYYWP